MSSIYKQLGRRIGALVDEKNAAYGSSFAASGAFLQLLYPNGLKPEQYAYALLLVRIFDKQMRIATDADALGESPFQDIAGYGLLGARMHEMRKNGCGSANGLSAVVESKEQSGSAGQSAPKPITTSDAGSSEKSSPQPLSERVSDYLNDTGAPAAVPSRRANAAGLVANVMDCNQNSECGMCPRAKGEWASVAGPKVLLFCSRECRDAFLRKVTA